MKTIRNDDNKSIILLSGGLDSLVCLGLCHEINKIKLAITFDYGQKSAQKEISASKKLCEFYNVDHRVLKLDWLKEMTHNALVNSEELPRGIDNPIESAKAVWVPNRNGLFLNIAAVFADADNYSNIIIGVNKEEAQTFSDNTQDFIDRINAEFEFSTQTKPKVLAPLINSDKNDIVSLALKLKMPLELVQSCYDGKPKHCGVCESCTRLKNALKINGDTYYTNLLFEK